MKSGIKKAPRIARSIRLPGRVWRASDDAALNASARAGTYQSANAILEAILSAGLGADSVVESERPSDARSAGRMQIEQMRAARRAKHAADSARRAALLEHLGALERSTSRAQKVALNSARAVVAKWRRNVLVAPMYLHAWESLLDAGLPSCTRALQRGAHELTAAALAANSPFIVGPTSRRRRPR